MVNVCVTFYCFTTKPRCFLKILKMKICFFESVLSSGSENTGPVIRDHVKFSQIRNKKPLQL